MKPLFEAIYKDNVWANGSGAGSTKEYCAPLVSFLCGYIRGSEAKVICDIGCGDMQWMPDVIRQTGVSYIGVDCVRSVIEANVAARYGEGFRFVESDASTDFLPDADLYIIKDVLQHWQSDTVLDFLSRFFASRPGARLLSANCSFQDSDERDLSNRTSFCPLSGDRYPLSLFRPEKLMSWETKVLLRLRPRSDE